MNAAAHGEPGAAAKQHDERKQGDLLRTLNGLFEANGNLAKAAADLDVQYNATLSDLQDLDYAKAISDFTLQKTYLEAAQSSFAKIAGLSLFNYL